MTNRPFRDNVILGNHRIAVRDPFDDGLNTIILHGVQKVYSLMPWSSILINNYSNNNTCNYIINTTLDR